MALVRSDAFIIGRSDTGDYKSLVDINITADFVQDFKPKGFLSEPEVQRIIGRDGIG